MKVKFEIVFHELKDFPRHCELAKLRQTAEVGVNVGKNLIVIVVPSIRTFFFILKLSPCF